MTTLLTPKITLSYLAYLGYSPSQNPITALRTTPPKKYELKKKGASSKNVFLGYCLGAIGSGKSSVLRQFGGGDFLEEGSGRGGRGKDGRRVVGVVESGGEQKYLVVSCQML